MLRIEAIRPGGGGIVANAGVALAKLGMRTAALACVGEDIWGDGLSGLLDDAGVETSGVLRQGPDTSATAVLVAPDGEHTFGYFGGASHRLDRQAVLDNLSLFARSKFALFGYYALMPELEADLPEALSRIRETGCRTALDAGGGGGGLQPLDRILPHLDIYVPSLEEAVSQTGRREPKAIIDAFRPMAPECLLGVKLGSRGALLSPAEGEWIEVEPVAPPAPIVDTTGAGDCFYAGLLTGLVRGLAVADAGRLGAAAGACSVTAMGAVAGPAGYRNDTRARGLAARRRALKCPPCLTLHGSSCC